MIITKGLETAGKSRMGIVTAAETAIGTDPGETSAMENNNAISAREGWTALRVIGGGEADLGSLVDSGTKATKRKTMNGGAENAGAEIERRNMIMLEVHDEKSTTSREIVVGDVNR